jgi:hypothetical protein
VNNFIQTTNPFALATPPAWFLAQLHAYDPLLCIVPSTCKPVYQVGRRGRFGHGLLRPVAGLPDTTVFAEHRLWPWKEILPEALGMQWARVLLELPDYDTQRFADPAGQLDDVEAKAERDLDASIADEADQRAAAMYRTYGLIEGTRVGAGSRPEGAGYSKLGQKKRAKRVYRPTGAGTGASFVGR